eukprot:TRINITY_DN94815_c0_g1_i1.p2 TRINITY_DN94815_c0_g1~~TRINITY_DN94815_c0_g1_i1.p2  ORF type:complete len:180 (+),score=92.46 TRINITY_DN94815_c0_g1_i1:21-560(+)
MGGVLSWLRSLFWEQEMQIAILGLQNAGKSSFVQVVNTGQFVEDMAPTIGFNMHKVKKGKVTIKVWDLGGQQRYRGMWERYCRGVDVIVFVVDASDQKMFQPAKKELNDLLGSPTLAHIPLLVLMNKNDLKQAVEPNLIAQALDLASIEGRDVVYFSISCKEIKNIDVTLDWLIKRSNS